MAHEFKKGDRVRLARTVSQQGATGTVLLGATYGWGQVAVELDRPSHVGIYEAWPDGLDLIAEESAA